MQKICGALPLILLLSACGGEQPAVPDNMADNVPVSNEADTTNYQAEVMALPLPARQGVFLRAVRDAGLQCQEVTDSEKLEDREGEPTWRAICDGRTPHIISISKDGTAKIISRSDTR